MIIEHNIIMKYIVIINKHYQIKSHQCKTIIYKQYLLINSVLG